MAIEEPEKLNKIETLKNKLWGRGYRTQVEFYDTFPHHKEVAVEENWQNDMPKLKKNNSKVSVFQKFFIFSACFFILAILYVVLSSVGGLNKVSNENIDIAVLGNTFTAGGEKLPLTVEITNRNNAPLELVDLIAEYPRGSGNGIQDTMERQRIALGTIPSGGIRSENLNIVLFGEQDSIQPVKIWVEYRFKDSNAIFTKEKKYEVTISTTPVNLLVTAPAEVSPDQDVRIDMRISMNTTEAINKNMLVKVDYPLGFDFVSASPKPDLGDNIWELNDIKPGEERLITFVGKMVDVFDGEEKTFKIWSGAQIPGQKSEIGVVYNSLAQKILIKKPFIEARLFVNNEYAHEYAVETKGSISVGVAWANNLDTKVNDLTIVASISGNAFDRKTVQTRDGFYNSIDNNIVWDKNSTKSFAEVGPGETGIANFSLRPNPLLSAGSGLLKDPTINISVSISGKQSVDGNTLKKLETTENKKIKIITDATFGTKILYYTGPFQNSGPIPPKVEKETTYTVLWTLTNTSNNLRNAQIRSSLPTWVRYVGSVSPASEDVTYNPANREIVWNVGNIPRGAGINGAPVKELAFQIAFLPSLSQVDETPILINDAVLTATDDFANVGVEINKPALMTNAISDPVYTKGSAKVVE